MLKNLAQNLLIIGIVQILVGWAHANPVCEQVNSEVNMLCVSGIVAGDPMQPRAEELDCLESEIKNRVESDSTVSSACNYQFEEVKTGWFWNLKKISRLVPK